MRKRPEPIPDIPGDKIVLRKAGRLTVIEVRRSTRSPKGIRYKCEGKFYDTLYEAFIELFTNGWSGSTIRTDRIPRTNKPKQK